MRLVDLEPRWLAPYFFVFRSPTNPAWWQSCAGRPMQHREQRELVEAAAPDLEGKIQFCDPASAWTITGTDFESLTVTPSLDGSKGGLWHGHITNGAIV